MAVIAGLWNPEPRYRLTRHNVGAMVVDVLADRMGARFRSHRSRADVAEGRLVPGAPKLVLARPRTYMNESGGPVAGLAGFFKIPLDRIVVVHDELDLPSGSMRIKAGGGDNGHNGLKSLRRSLGSGEFLRVRFGIGRPPGSMDPAAFVLRPFAKAEREALPVDLERAADAIEALVSQGLERAQNEFND